jgi:hypothetical protein
MTAVAWAAAILGATLGAAAVAAAQTADVQRPRTLVVGTPGAGARTDRIDSARSGRSATALPRAGSDGLRTEWRTVLAATIDVAPVVDDRGTTYVVGTHGEVFAIGRDGSEEWHASSAAIQASAPALLSDGTLVFTDAAGEAIAVRAGAVRWRVRFGRSDAARAVPPSPLALDDGGVVVATAHDLSTLDSEGHERSRTTLPEPVAAPLVAAAALGKVVAIAASGAVWTWSPGASETTRVATFGGPIDDSAALADDHTLVAVTGGRLHIVAIDLVRGTATIRAVAPTGLWLGPPSMEGGIAHLLLQVPTGELALGIDGAGAETSRALLTTHPPAIAAPDGGVAPVVPLPHTPLLVDATGTLGFATADGGVGVVSAGVVDLLADVCPLLPGNARGVSAPTAALLPLGSGAFLAACRSGMLVAIRAGTPALAPGGP